MRQEIVKINPEFSKEEFVRKAWITLAQEDAPLEIYQSDFSDVSQHNFQVFYNTISFKANWQAEIGNDRTETYTDYEKYYEKIPYTDYETRYNSQTKQNETKPVTKYRQEERQRAVTKTRIVTDWNFGNGTHSGVSSNYVCLDSNENFRMKQFIEDSNHAKTSPLDKTDREMQITESMFDLIDAEHAHTIYRDVHRSIPGDHNKNLSYDIKESENLTAILMSVPEYRMSIKLKDKTYHKNAFPFGSLTIDGETPKSRNSLEKEKQQREDALSKTIFQREQVARNQIWKLTSKLSLPTLGLLSLSIVVSLFVRFLFPVIAIFLCSVAAFILSSLYTKRIQTRETYSAMLDNSIEEDNFKKEFANYSRNHKNEILNALNKKLKSLGFDPASPEEYNVEDKTNEGDEDYDEDEET